MNDLMRRLLWLLRVEGDDTDGAQAPPILH